MIDAAKKEVHLSYFEYAFLAALLIFVDLDVEVIVLEVGLGGRLDATNAIDADVSIITTVDIDHTQWLGHDIETIAKEKAGIMRPNKSLIYGDLNTPEAIKSHALTLVTKLIEFDRAHQIGFNTTHFNYQYEQTQFNNLIRPKLKGDWQLKNFANALTALIELGFQFDEAQVQQAIDNWHINGRMQTMQSNPLVIADVAHNKQSASQLAQWLKDNPCDGYTKAVFSVLGDKQLEQWLGLLREVVDHWFIFQLPGERAMELLELKMTMTDHVHLISQFDSGKQAYQVALRSAKSDDRIIVFGSFHVLDEVFK
jgi:dihydrofolate synthase/folylpolyglutamate synthase